MMNICNRGHKQNKYRARSEVICLKKMQCKKYCKKKESEQRRMQRNTKKIFYSVLGNNITFDVKVSLFRIIISDDGTK